MTNKPQQGLIRPFNSDSAVYAAMFEEAPPPFLKVLVSMRAGNVLNRGPRVAVDQSALIQRVTALPEAKPDTCGLNVQMTFIPDVAFHLDAVLNCPDRLLTEVPPTDICIQISFVESGWDLAGRAPRWAMGILDRCVLRTGSIEPGYHGPLVAGRGRAKEYQSVVRDLYVSRRAIWCRELVEYRNKLGVMLRAELFNRDPVVEYNRFLNSGGKYYLEYTQLCP